jgi:16S rRNA (cytosine967-C5)-methyltransferase
MQIEGLSTRALAANTLRRILTEGAYSNVVIANQPIGDSVDRGLYQRLVYETLRYLPGIDQAIERATTRSIDRIQAEVLAVLRIATAEMRYLHRPAHSSVSLSVDAVQELGKPRAAGFVNGVLRTVARRVSEPVPADAHLGMPQWLYDRLVAVFGSDADAFITASNLPPPTGVRSRDGAARGLDTGVPGTGYLHHDAAIGEMAAADLIDVMDPASVAVVDALGVVAGDRAVDLAAAPGGKTRIIAERCAPDGHVVATDIHQRRLARARERLCDLDNVSWIAADAAEAPFRTESFDKVLLDAPCTGLGTLRRRPEIRLRLEPDSPSRYGSFQRRMLIDALRLVRNGGRLVYSVCTVFPEETIDVVAGLGGHRPQLDVGAPWGDGVLLAPHITGTDGMFIVTFDR